MFKVRFHLGAGPHFLQWQVRGPKSVEYHDPLGCSLVLKNCTLKNNRRVAERVLKSQKRDVCGYILCESVERVEGVLPPEGRVVHFDPKLVPYWTVDGLEGVQDGLQIPILVSSGRRLRIP